MYEKFSSNVHVSRGEDRILIRLERVGILQQNIQTKVSVLRVVAIDSNTGVNDGVDWIILNREHFIIMIVMTPGVQNIS